MGSEQEGIRPVLIVQSDRINKKSPTVIVVIITSKLKKMYMATHLYLPRVRGLRRKSAVFCEKMREIDTSRLLTYCDSVSEKFMKRVDRGMKAALDIGYKVESYQQRQWKGKRRKKRRRRRR